ncbi:MAG: hypothetical protein J5711_05840 [Bacteroidales bacterium]|nr:hypothetical protein [Bacteroidales bacterium]
MKPIILFSALLFGQLFFTQPQQSESSGEVYVYVCTGSSSKRYHNNTQCRGLQNCKGEIRRVTLSQAKEANRTPCKLCYGN